MKLALKILLPILLIAGAIFGGKKLISMKAPPEKREIKEAIPTVKVIRLSADTHRPEVRSYGTVQSFDEARLTPELSAKIVWISDAFRVGKEVSMGEELVRLEKRDFEIALEQQQASVSEIQRQLEEEKVRSQQAADDWVVSGRKLEDASDFRLRKPQLAALEAQLKSAEAGIDQAKLNLGRTTIRSPFDAKVLTRTANLGELATPQANLGTLTSTTKAEIRLPLTLEQIDRIGSDLSAAALQTSNLEVKLSLPDHDGSRSAKVVRLDPTIDARNQVRYLIAEIDSPFKSSPFPLPIGTFVNASFEGRPLENSLRFPESALVEDRYVWTLKADNTLGRLELERLATEDGDVIARPETTLSGPIDVVTRPLTTFRPGNPVQLEEGSKESSTEDSETPAAPSES